MDPARRALPTRYAASFCTGSAAPAAGSLLVEENRLLLEGRSPDGHTELSIPYAELSEVRVGRLPEERLNGHPTLFLVRKDSGVVRVAPMGFGLLHGLTELVAALANEHADERERVAVVLPLRKGGRACAQELVERGPPFDPAVLGLARHDVFLTDDEAIFVFQGRNVRSMLERLTRDPTLWQVGLAWRRCVAGRPRLSTGPDRPSGRPIFSWTAESEMSATGPVSP